jgi:hypothetical protein
MATAEVSDALEFSPPVEATTNVRSQQPLPWRFTMNLRRIPLLSKWIVVRNGSTSRFG